MRRLVACVSFMTMSMGKKLELSNGGIFVALDLNGVSCIEFVDDSKPC